MRIKITALIEYTELKALNELASLQSSVGHMQICRSRLYSHASHFCSREKFRPEKFSEHDLTTLVGPTETFPKQNVLRSYIKLSN